MWGTQKDLTLNDSPRNLFKHLKDCYQTKTNREMLQHDFHFSTNVVIFFSKKEVIEYSLFMFIFHICAKFQRRKRLVVTCIFGCFQSHCHILKELHEFFVYVGCTKLVLEKLVSYLVLWVMDWWQSQLRLSAHLKRW